MLVEVKGMPKKLVSDELWSIVEPLLPQHIPSPKGGRPRISDRAALTGIIFVLKTGIPWEELPQEMGCGSGMTCWRRLQEWQKAGVWEKIHCSILQPCTMLIKSTGPEFALTVL